MAYDPNAAPQPGDAPKNGYDSGYTDPSGPPQSTILPTEPSPTPPAATLSGKSTDPNEIAKQIKSWAASNTGYNPSVTNDTNYWVSRIMQTHPDGNIDWGYWQSRFMQPEGAPEGSTGGTSNTMPPPMNYQQALQYVQGKLGYNLSQDQINSAFSKFGGTPNDTFTTSGLDPVVSYFQGLKQNSPPPVDTGGTNTGNYTSTSTFSKTGDPGVNQLLAILLGRANQSLSIDPNTDSIIGPQLTAARAQGDRVARNQYNDAVEAGSPYSSGAANTMATQLAEKNAQGVNSLQTQLVSNELASRRAEVQNALSEMGGLLTSQDQLALQKELGILDAAIRQQQVGNQNSQFYAGLNQNQNQFQQSLNSQNDQFALNYDLNSTTLANYWDWLRRGNQ